HDAVAVSSEARPDAVQPARALELLARHGAPGALDKRNAVTARHHGAGLGDVDGCREAANVVADDCRSLVGPDLHRLSSRAAPAARPLTGGARAAPARRLLFRREPLPHALELMRHAGVVDDAAHLRNHAADH